MKKNNGGFSLVGVLATALIGSLIVAGGFQLVMSSMRSSDVAQFRLIEEALRNVLVQNLSNADNKRQCKNFKDANTDFTPSENLKGLGELKKLKFYHSDGDTQGTVLLEKNKEFQGSLKVILMKLEKVSTEENPTKDPKTEEVTRIFSVYYEKKGLGGFRKLGGKDKTCSGDINQASAQDGCYFYQCKIKYKLKADNTVDSCEIEKENENLLCSSSGKVALNFKNQKCDTTLGQYLRGFNEQGGVECGGDTFTKCEAGEVLQGTECALVPTILDNTQKKHCSPGTFFKGFTEDGESICDI